MSHGITEIDRGVIQGDTWHKREEYKRQDVPVTVIQCREIFDYPMEIRASYGMTENANGVKVRYKIPGSNHILRTDKNTLIAPMVGDQFHLMDNMDFINWVDNTVLSKYPDVSIESCGTLFGGSGQFISMAVGEYHVKGDDSATVMRILYHHQIGVTAYSVCLNKVRVVCDNTRAMAQYKASMMMKRKHTKGADDDIKEAVFDMASAQSTFKRDNEMENFLAGIDMTGSDVKSVLEELWPTEGKDKGRSLTIAKNKHKKVLDLYEGGQQGFLAGYDRTAYAFLNAITDMLGNETIRNNGDIGMDNLIGTRSAIKQKAEKLLVKCG